MTTSMLEELLRLRGELERATAPLFHEPSRGVFPAVNIYDDGETFLVRAEVPGVRKDALEVTAQNDQLVIRGERVVQGAHDHASYHRREREGGRFRRIVTLPERVDGEKIAASLRDGVLEVSLPRAPEHKPRRIAIG